MFATIQWSWEQTHKAMIRLLTQLPTVTWHLKAVYYMIIITLRSQNQLGLEMAIQYQLLELVRSRSFITQLHNIVKELFVGWLMCYTFTSFPIICLVFMQQLPQGIQTYCTVSFRHKYCWIQNKNKKVIGTVLSLGKLYKFDCKVQQLSAENATIAEEYIASTSIIGLWHQRLLHVPQTIG